RRRPAPSPSYGPDQEYGADECDADPGNAYADAAYGPARQQAKCDAGEVKQAGRHHESDRERDRVGAGWQLRAMCVTMEDRKASHEHGSGDEASTYRQRNHAAKRDRG